MNKAMNKAMANVLKDFQDKKYSWMDIIDTHSAVSLLIASKFPDEAQANVIELFKQHADALTRLLRYEASIEN